MKKFILIALGAFLFSSVLTSCHTHHACAGVTGITSHAGKVKTSALVRPI